MANFFSAKDLRELKDVVRTLTSYDKEDPSWINHVINFVQLRMRTLGAKSLAQYFAYIAEDAQEFELFISNVTIHKTDWFRETNHFSYLLQEIKKRASRGMYQKTPFRALSAACSTGQEVYTLGVVLETIRRIYPKFEYEISAFDIDTISLKTAARAIYPIDEISRIPQEYSGFLLRGRGRAQGQFTVIPEIRKRCRFYKKNLAIPMKLEDDHYDLIMCRNVFIYFNELLIARVLTQFSKAIKPGAFFIAGTSEIFKKVPPLLHPQKQSIYLKDERVSSKKAKIRILIVDDSPTIIKMVSNALSGRGIEIHTALNTNEADAVLRKEKIDLISLDIHMPDKNGIDWLKEIRARGVRIPVVLLTDANREVAQQVLESVNYGAQEFINKRLLNEEKEKLREIVLGIVFKDVSERVKDMQAKDISKALTHDLPRAIVVGASTGGVDALHRLFKSMPANTPPIVVVQHIETSFAQSFLDGLCKISGLKQGDITKPLKPGHIYSTVKDCHVSLYRRKSGDYFVNESFTAPMNSHRPSVDVLFRSCLNFGSSVWSILLTGMGRDGAQGMAELKKKGALTITQNRTSCVIYGMPRKADELGASTYSGSPEAIRKFIVNSVSKRGTYSGRSKTA